MITLDKRKGRICWEHNDAVAMSTILGSEDAIKCWAPMQPSILKLAAKKALFMDSFAASQLAFATAWRKECREWQKLEDAEIDDPKAEKLFPHQRADLWYMDKAALDAYLVAHEVGVGKTPVSIRFGERRGAERVAVITPNTAKDQWRDEIVRWRSRKAPIRLVEGSVKEQSHIITTMKSGWVIGHWESLTHARDAWLDSPWDYVILDEGQWMQNRNAKRTETAHALAKITKLRVVNSAHPYTNAVDELFPILQFLYPALYPSFWRWAYQHIQIDAKPFGGLDLSTPRRPKLLQWEMRPYTIRRAKKDVWKSLPPVTRLKRVVTLGTKASREYQKLRKQFFVELQGYNGKTNILAIPSILARITRLRQYLIDPGILGSKQPSVKYQEVSRLLDEIGKPTVLFTTYRQVAERLQHHLKKEGRRVDILVGGMKKRVKPLKKRFLRGELDAVIIMTKVGGTALNFGKYGYYAHVDMPMNPRDFEQTEGRVDRPEEGTGKMVATTGFRILVKDSYEERMEGNVVGKHMDFTKVFTVNTAMELFGDDDED